MNPYQPSPNPAAQWQPNGTPQTPQPGQPGPAPPQQTQPAQSAPTGYPNWAQPPPQPNNAQYQQQRPPQNSPNPNQPLPPMSSTMQQAPMPAPMQAQQQQDYRAALPPPHGMYPQPPYQGQMQYAQGQPAPRQRTAIACRYCRRRKIRCSGFDQSEDGRCTNCVRFSQECVFTPVSAQTQAFVPAHTVWRGQNPPPNTQLYGAYGQPLPQHGAPPGQYAPPPQAGQYAPPPMGYQQQPMYPQAPVQGQSLEAGQKRPNEEPHTPTLPPNQRDGQAAYAAYPDPSGLTAERDPNADASMGAPEKKEEAPRSETRDFGIQVDIHELGL